jgi:hypothetical protein
MTEQKEYEDSFVKAQERLRKAIKEYKMTPQDRAEVAKVSAGSMEGGNISLDHPPY